ncbi:hypothetical protein HMPREF1544_12403, partial [Mucor circinelloides 1006PhL]
WQVANSLDRMLYVNEFDCFVAVTYKGAPPFCHFCRHRGHIRAKCQEVAKRRCFKCGKQGHMLRFCPETKDDDQASYLKKKNIIRQVQEVTKPRAATIKTMALIDKERMGKDKEENEDENLESDSNESASLQGDDSDGSVDASENDKSTAGETLEEDPMEDLKGEGHQDKYTKDEDMQDEQIILAGLVNKATYYRNVIAPGYRLAV